MKHLQALLIAAFLALVSFGVIASQAFTVIPNTGTVSGLTLVNTINANEAALATTSIGTSVPSYVAAGTMWVDSTNKELKINDGTQDEPIGFYDTVTGNFTTPVLRIANASSTGTTLNKLATLTGAPSTAVAIGTTTSNGILGVVASGAGTTGNVHIVMEDYTTCVFDGATTAGDYVQASTSTAADCHDASSTFPTSGQVLGRVLTTNGGGGTYGVYLFGPEIRGTTSGGSGTVTTSGSPASGNLAKFSGSTVVTNTDLTGDVTTSGASATTVAKIAGVAVGTPSGTTNVAFTNGPTFVTPALGAATGTSLALTSTDTSTIAIGTASADGHILTNTTSAAANSQQWSPRLRFTGQGWKTNSTAGSQEVDIIGELETVQGTANPTGNFIIKQQVNSGGYAALVTIPTGGGFNLNSGTYQIGGTQITCSALSNGATGCSTATGTSGSTIPLLNGANTWSGLQTFNTSDLSAGNVLVTANTVPTNGLYAPSAITSALSANSTEMVAIGTGGVGINTATPLAMLHVHGGAIVSDPVALTISTATFTPVAVGANDYRVVLIHASCPCTIANPSGTAVDGQKFTLEVWQSATGSDTVGTWGTNYDFGTAGSPTLTATASKGDILGFMYSAQNSKYNYLGIQQGM